MKLTTANIGLPKGKADAIFFDSELTGFGLRVRVGSGDRIIRNWIIQYRAHGHARRMLVGSAEKLTAAEARKQATKLLSKVVLGHDPQAEKHERREKDTLSLRSVVADYIAHKQTGVKEQTMRMLRAYLEGPLYLKPLHGMPIDRITRKDVAARLLAVSKTSGAPTAISLRSALSAMFSWGMEMGLVEHNPVVNAFRPVKPKARDRVLNDTELAAIWRALDEDGDYGKVIKLLILTGCRREEIGGTRWSEFDFDKSAWTLPATRSKNGKPHTLPLTPLMLSIIDSIPRQDRVDILFGRKHGFTTWALSKKALDAKLDLPAWVHHDIRRSVATGMANIGIQPHIIEQVLNHQSGSKAGVAGTYNRSPYEREVKAAMALWADHVCSIVEGRERTVIPMRREQA